jgi:repressor of nif and glnA expression
MSLGHGGVDRSLEVLRERGLAREVGANRWTITTRGLQEARRLSGGEEGEK